MFFLNSEATREALPMADAVEAMVEAFSGNSDTPLRTLLGGSLVMPGLLDDHMAVKVVSTVPGNPAGLVALFGPDGGPVGIVDGPTMTSIRTAAVSGLATKLLAPESASTLAMLGAGAMAFDQVEAVRAVRDIERVLVWSRDPENALKLSERVGGRVVVDADEAVAKADVVSCATPARAPLFSFSAVSRGTHFNAVGAFTPEMVELPADLVRESFVVVDDYEAAAEEAGDLIQAGVAPDVSLGELLADPHPEVTEAFTVFKSVGVAAQDVAGARWALANAAANGLGVELK